MLLECPLFYPLNKPYVFVTCLKNLSCLFSITFVTFIVQCRWYQVPVSLPFTGPPDHCQRQRYVIQRWANGHCSLGRTLEFELLYSSVVQTDSLFTRPLIAVNNVISVTHLENIKRMITSLFAEKNE